MISWFDAGNNPMAVLVWIALFFLLYLARQPAHQAIKSGCRVVNNALRLAARSVLRAERRFAQRNREVLLAAGAEEMEREVAREFHRVEAVVQRDLQGYPAFHRNMSDLITRIDEDYGKSAEVPPSPPSWSAAVETVASLAETKDGMVHGILTEIHKSLGEQHRSAIEAFRKSSTERHALLKNMMPYWRKLANTIEDVGKTITGLHERAAIIDRRMSQYEAMLAGSDAEVRRLSSSSLTQFFIAGLVMLIAIGGAIINFNLIALPMSEMVGGGSYIGPFKTADVAAMVIILVEAAMGLFLMESLRVTRLFPVIGSMDDRMRRRMTAISFTILLVLAGVESALAFMRDQIAGDTEALRQSLAGAEAVVSGSRSIIPTIGQMVMGFVLPFALTFVAIPLESFVHSSRTVLGLTGAGLLRAVAFALRLLGNLAHQTGRLVTALYDLLVFPFLWFEQKIFRRRPVTAEATAAKEVSL